ncbi:SpdD protein [Streptomyces sp. NPDC006173]|uniref:SpdD protein n=1 Tax=Streptomyces sp. NPDC006173 TaxID=3155349 RepID=UPI0033EEECB3
MLLRPKMPDAAPLPIAQESARPTEHHHAPAACSCAHAPMTSAGRSVSPLVSRGASAVAAVFVVGVVLTALLATVAITAVSVSIAALVLRSLLSGAHKR